MRKAILIMSVALLFIVTSQAHAGMFGHKKRDLFKADSGAEKATKLKFN